jgi:hypothetical protein
VFEDMYPHSMLGESHIFLMFPIHYSKTTRCAIKLIHAKTMKTFVFSTLCQNWHQHRGQFYLLCFVRGCVYYLVDGCEQS